MDLSVTSREQGGRTVVVVGGEIDVYTAPVLRERLNELVAEGHHQLVVDMESVEFLDSTGLGVLVGGLKKVRQHDGSLHLALPPAQAADLVARGWGVPHPWAGTRLSPGFVMLFGPRDEDELEVATGVVEAAHAYASGASRQSQHHSF